jgi:hypothetical protein
MERADEPVDEEERAADSPLVASIRRARYRATTTETVLPDGSWDLLFIRKAGGPVIAVQTGQIAAPLTAVHEAGDELLVLTFKPEVYMPQLPGHKIFQQGVVRPVEHGRGVWIDAERLELPTFDNAEHLVAAMARKGLLERDPVVARALQGASQRLDERSIQRHFSAVTGLSFKGFQQIARAREAARLLRSGQSPSDVAAELAFSDQSHMTHSLKRFLGQTPSQLAKQHALRR